MGMDLWYRLAMREFSDVTEHATELLAEVEDNDKPEAEEEPEPPQIVSVDFG